MRILYSLRPEEMDCLGGSELRERFLIEDLFAPGETRLVHTGLDRLVVGGVVPEREIDLPVPESFRSRCFNERRETGVINIGAPGEVIADGERFALDHLECLYIGMGARRISFKSGLAGQSAFYLLSCPAHCCYPTRRAGLSDADISGIGSAENASRRRIVRYIHEDGIESCQLVMGYTELESGSVWNTWPPHTHQRRSEIYFYFDLGENLLMHFLGVPERARHIVVRDRQAVLSPPWSIHSGVGTASYRFIWGMAGENRSFNDMDPADPRTIK